MKVYIDRNNSVKKIANLLPMEYLKWDNNVYEIWLIAVREVSPPFDEEPCTALEQGLSFIFFPANKERRQLWNSTVNRYIWI